MLTIFHLILTMASSVIQIILAKEAEMNKYCLKLIDGHKIGNVTERVYTHRTIESLAAEIEKIG